MQRMEQIKVIESLSVNTIEREVNNFLASLKDDAISHRVLDIKYTYCGEGEFYSGEVIAYIHYVYYFKE